MNAKPEAAASQDFERRAHPRHRVEERATLCLLGDGSIHQARLVEVSRGGCRIALDRHVALTAKSRVEIAFKLNGVALRLTGEAQWDKRDGMIGIRFAEMAERRRNALIDLLAEIAADFAAKAAQQTEPPPAKTEAPSDTVSSPLQHRDPAGISPDSNADNSIKRPPPRERRLQKRIQIDLRATIFLINGSSKIHGTILDVSKDGCRIRTDERFPVGIYRRVEVEFALDGLPFRLSGVTQAMHDRCLVGIRFLDLSQRKQDHLAEMIDEMDQARKESGATDGLRA